ncbi:MAG: sodium/solute symporter [Pirellulales bacterium]|nr:sodium/solute symporter [Pirellulales bacterium]
MNYQLSGLDWTIFIGYLAVIFVLGLYFMRGDKNNEDYFVGGRRMPWFAVGVSLFATAFSSLSFVALPREGAYGDYHLLVTYLCIPLVITPLLWWVFVPLYRRLGVTSVYEYLEVRYNRHMRRLGTLLFALYAIGWMGSMVYAVGLIVKAVLHLDDGQFTLTLVGVGLFATLYTSLGGFRAVIWTDVLQALTLGGGMLLVLLLTVDKVDGGWAAIIQMGTENGKFNMFDMDPDITHRQTFLSACSLGLFAYLPGYTISQVTVQRYVSTSSLAGARRCLTINAVVATVVAVLFFFTGTAIYAFYHQAGGAGFPALDRQDQLLPYFVLNEIQRTGLTGLLVAGLFAAVMSTIDSGINSMTTVVVCDWLSDREISLGASRMMCAGFGLCVIGAALVAPYLGEHVIDIISVISGSFLGLLFGVFLIGMFIPGANAGGAIVGLVAGMISLICIWSLTSVSGWWYGFFTSVPVIFVGTAASYLFPRPRQEQLRGMFFQP